MSDTPAPIQATAPVEYDRAKLVLAAVAFSLLSAYVCGITFVAALKYALPETDLAYKQPLLFAYLNPFVWSVAIPYCTLVGFLVSPVAFFCLRKRDPVRGGLFSLVVTLLFIASATFASPLLGLLGSPAVAVVALVLCRLSAYSTLQPRYRPWLAR